MSNGQKSDIKKVNEKTVDAYSDFGGLIKHTARYILWLPEAKTLRQEENRFLKYFTLPDNQPPFSETFQAIEKIIEKHVEGNHFPFVIFLTMKAFDGETNTQAKEQLIQNIETNRANISFAQQIAAVIPDTQNFVAQSFTDFIVISVPKIICHLAERHCDLEVRSRAKYLRSNAAIGNFFITKFVFKFSRRKQSHLAVINQNYINNVRNIMRLDNVIAIDNTSITQDIRRSNDELKQYIEQMNQNPLESQ